MSGNAWKAVLPSGGAIVLGLFGASLDVALEHKLLVGGILGLLVSIPVLGAYVLRKLIENGY